jgi:hypothetical protein
LRESKSPEVMRMLKEIAPGTHAVLIYDSAESKREVLFSHLSLGAHNSKLVYICSEESPNEIEDAMKDFGIRVQELRSEGRLAILDYEEVYMKDGRVDVAQAIGHLSHLALTARRENLEGGLRVAEEMSFFFRPATLTDLATYETRRHRTFYFDARGICAYNLTQFQASGALENLLAILHQRDRVVLTGPKGVSILEPDLQDHSHILV